MAQEKAHHEEQATLKGRGDIKTSQKAESERICPIDNPVDVARKAFEEYKMHKDSKEFEEYLQEDEEKQLWPKENEN